MATTTFKPKQVTKKILSPLRDRAYDVIINRFGLNNETQRKTLEAIGNTYGITRERVRQIENAALNSIRKSDEYKGEKASFDELKSIMEKLGSIVSEEEFLGHISKDQKIQNHIHLYLVLHDDFKKEKEDENFKTRWYTDEELAGKIHASLKNLYESLSDEDLIPEGEIVAKFFDHLKDISEKYKNEEIAKRYLSLSKNISKNPLGDWGITDSSNVNTRGIKDYAFLMMRKHGSPMHFREVAEAISNTFGKKTHFATCHNELIKDNRFVLVGRGIYALAEWGYKSCVVKDVIKDI